ncbi:MAG: hypothetical protein OXI03_01760 [Chloroflexota bacterium]|nr:hypothetical protein [Chloroflexota bacterium]
MTRAVDGHVITGARCSACGREFPLIMDCYDHTLRDHGRRAVPEIIWTPRQPDLFDLLEGEARNN